MSNNTRKYSRRSRRPAYKPEPELQWLEDGINALAKHTVVGLFKAGRLAVKTSSWAVSTFSPRK